MSGKPNHDFHLVNPSPWPFMGSMSVLTLAVSAVLFIHDKPFSNIALLIGFGLVIATMYLWWKDVVHEGIKEKAHTNMVRHGLRMGMAFFILSEVMFFFAFFFSFFHSALLTPDILDGLWPKAEGVWPPEGTKTFDPWDLPFINTLILLLSGTTVTWAHHALIHNNQRDLVRGLALTVALGITFTCLQAYEYSHAGFGFKDGIYASNFYMATGFHGFHVIVGTIFLAVCLIRAMKGHFTPEGHLGFEFAAWYWHFVDVVWLFLFVCIYWWGS